MKLGMIDLNTKIALLATSLILCQPLHAAKPAPVGSDSGNIEITSDGQAVWSMPIAVPPGVAGLVPKLSISVSAQGQLNLSGLSAISRCPGIDSNDIIKPVAFVASDDYCLSGQPLVLISGQQGMLGSVYHTKMESFQKIEVTQNGLKGPEQFTITTSSGGKLVFGETPNSRTTYAATGINTSWSISSLKDPSGNGLWYHYSDISETAIAEIALTKISYASKTKADAPVTVEFSYQTRPDSSSGYQLGTLVQSSQRLAKITTRADNLVARKYKMGYEQAEFGGYSRINKVYECAATDECYRPSEFHYAPIQTGWKSVTQTLTQPSPLQDSKGRGRGLITDINNDGLNDWIIAVQPQTGSAQIQTWLGSKTGWTSAPNFNLPGVLLDYAINPDGIPLGNLVDMNADGLVDYYQAYRHIHADGSETQSRKLWLNTGSGFALSSSLTPPDYALIINADNSITAYDKYVDINADGLPDQIRAVRLKSGADSHITRLNTGTGWQVSSVYKLPDDVHFSDYTIGTQGAYQGELLDINGDGLLDFVQSAKLSAGLTRNQTLLNTGNGWRNSTEFAMPTPLTDYSDFDKGVPTAELADINGDGLIDIWQAVKLGSASPLLNAWLNTGTGFIVAPAYKPPLPSNLISSSGETHRYADLMDVNGDGRPELVEHSIEAATGSTRYNIYQHTGAGWATNAALKAFLPSIPFYLQPADGSASQRLLQMADLDNDAAAEAFTSRDITNNGWQVHSAKNDLSATEKAGYLTQHINGLGVATRIEYALSTDSEVYTPSFNSVQEPRLVSLNAPMLLVKRIKKMDGLLHPSLAKDNDESSGWYAVSHHYDGLKASIDGKGGAGFKTRTIIDQRTGLKIISQFHQDYPFTGQAKQVSKYLNETLLSEVITDSAQRNLFNGKTRFTYSPKVTSKQYDPDSGALISTSVSEAEYNDLGNTTSKTQTLTGEDNQSFKTVTKTEYEQDKASGTDWLFGMPTRTTVTVSAPNQPDQTNKTTAKYDSKGFPESETLEPGHAQSVTTTSSYDGFGNVTSSTISSSGITRTTSATYSADGRFPETATNPLGHISQIKIDPRWGKPTSKINPNGVEQKTLYDEFGTIRREDVLWDKKTQSKEIVLAYWCENNAHCPANAVSYVGALDTEGNSPQTVYYDAYGRELLKKTLGPNLSDDQSADTETIYMATVYDKLGRKIKTSLPGTNLNALNYDEVKYDALDRVKTRIAYGSASDGNTETTITYQGLTVTTTNAKGYETSVTNDLRGKPIEVTDADKNVTRYEYDAKGNLTKTKTNDSDDNVIELTYDLFGRKTAMDDPDMGHWAYKYDGFGNLSEQTDAKEQDVTMEYDALGRLTSRTEAEGTTTWEYDTATLGTKLDANGEPALARGQLASVSAPHDEYKRIHYYDASGRPTKEITRIKSRDYTSERGYYRASSRVTWEQYPSGLVLTKDYDPTGYPKKLESVDLNAYQDYLDEMYIYEDKIEDAKELQRQKQAEITQYQDLLLGEEIGRDEEGKIKYAGGGLDDQIKTTSDLITAAVSKAQYWQGFASEAGAVLNDHSQWYQKYFAEYEWYESRYTSNARKAEEAYDRARPHIDAYDAAMASAKENFHAACIAGGREIHYTLAADLGEYCGRGIEVGKKGYTDAMKDILTGDQTERIFGMGNGRRDVCVTLTKTSERGANVITHECIKTIDAFSWLPTRSVPYKENTGREYVCDGTVTPPPTTGGSGGGGRGDGGGDGRNIVWVAQALALGALAWFDDANAERDGPLCYWRTKYANRSATMLYGADYGKVNSKLEVMESDFKTAEVEGKLAEPDIKSAEYHSNQAKKYIRGTTVYGAMASNHGLVAQLLGDEDTGRYTGYRKNVETYAGKWQCKKPADINPPYRPYINGENPSTTEKQWIADYKDMAKPPFKPSPIAGARLKFFDMDDDGKDEAWYINTATEQMVQAEKRPIYKREHCEEDELWAQTSGGTIGTHLTALYNDTPFFHRNYIYHKLQELTAPINDLVELANEQYEIVKTKKSEFEESSSVYWEALAYTIDGQIKNAKYGNGVESAWGYDARGRSKTISAKKGNEKLQDMFFTYDKLGNLTQRNDIENGILEKFTYDRLNRVVTSDLSGTGTGLYKLTDKASQSFEYNAIGNITYKSDVGTYEYGTGAKKGGAGVHALVSTTGGAINASFTYDANGNQEEGYNRTTDWTSYNKPSEINKTGATNEFIYGPERQMVYQLEKIGDQARETRYIGGIFEETIKAGGVPEAVHHLTISGQTIAVLKTQPKLVDPNITLPLVNDTHYLHQDHLNSVVMITDNQGKVVEKNHYDVFGKKRLAIIDPANQTIIYAAGLLPITDRSYTDHRYLNGQELIHMKGRVYDPTFGRFLSADPHIQSPLMSQSLNRYSYVMNNPLSLTDPSGYFFSWLKKLFKKIMRTIKRIIKKIRKIIYEVFTAKYFRMKIHNWAKRNSGTYAKYYRVVSAIVVAVVVTIATGNLGLGKVAAAAVGGFASGFVATGSLEGALIGGVTAAAFSGVGGAFGAPGKLGAIGKGIARLTVNFSVNATSAVFYGLKTLAHGIVGGLSSKLSGGSFSKSFLSSAIVNALAPSIGKFGSKLGYYGDIAAAALVGGIASKLVGGEFASGAMLGAFAYWFNHKAHAINRGRYVNNYKTVNALKADMKPGDVVFYKRDLDGGPSRGGVYNSNVDRDNQQLLHEGMIYSDNNGDLHDTGYFGGGSGVRSGDLISSNRGFGGVSFSNIYSDTNVNTAFFNFRPAGFGSRAYKLLFWNCQDYADFLSSRLYSYGQ